MLDITPRSGLSEEQRLMRQSCRDFVDDVITPFIRSNWQREWDMNPQARLPPEILKRADEIGIRTLGVPEAAMPTRAMQKNGEWVINGRKQFISNGYDASLYVVYANTNPKVGMLQGTSSFLVPRDTPGLTVARCNETMGCRFMNNGELVFEDMRLPEDHLLTENDALGKAGVYFRPGKIIQAAKNLGVGVHAFEAAAEYVQNYVQGGRILIKHQAVALRLAEMATRIEAVRALLERAAQAVDDNAPDAETLCNMVKLFASEEILKVAQHCLELHGGNGVMLDFGVEKIFRDAAIFLHMDATVDISKMKIVKSMFPTTAGKYAGPE